MLADDLDPAGADGRPERQLWIDQPMTWEPSVQFLRYAVACVLGGSTAFLVGLRLGAPDQVIRAVAVSSLWLLGAVAWALLQRGRLEATVWILALGVSTFVLVTSPFFGGQLSTSLMLFPPVIFLMGWLVGRQAAILFAALPTVATMGYAIADGLGLLPPMPVTPGLSRWVVQAVAFTLSAAMINEIVRSYRRRLAEVQRREKEVLEARNQLAATLDAIPDLLFELGLDGRHFAVHSRTSELLAAPAEDLLGRTVSEVLPPEAAQAVLAALQEASEKGRSHGRTLELPLQRGRVWFELSVSRKQVARGEEDRFIVLARDVTKRLGAETALREREVQLQSILAATADGILAVDREGRVLCTNERFRELWGIPKPLLDSGDDGAMLGHVAGQLVDPAAFAAKVQALYGSDAELTDHVAFLDGRVLERYTAPLLSGGRSVGRVWSFRDVTERQRSAAALVASRNLLQSVIDTAPVRVFWKDRELRYLGCNPVFARDAGAARPEEVVGRSDFDLSWAHHAEAYRADDRAVIESGEPRLDFEESQASPVGQERWLRTSKVPLRGADGEVIGVLGIYDDETERRRIERRLSLAVEVTQVFLWEFDAVKRELAYDRALLGALGLEGGEPRSLDDWMALVHPDDRPGLLGQVEQALQTEGYVLDAEYRMSRGGGTHVWIQTRGAVVRRDPAGAPLLAVGTSMDVTRRKEDERALVAAREAAEAANRAKSEFLANMSHEIRTPLNGVLGNIQLLEMTHLEGEQQGYAKAISTAGTSLLSLINDILDLSKLEADKLGLEAAPFGLRAAIDSVVTMQRSRALEKGLRLVLRLPPDLPETLLGDELRIRQVLMNLLSNAIKFTAAGSVTVAAAVVERTAERVQLELSVADTGIGIGPRVLGTIFEPFVQGDSSTTRRFGGTGLGLTICKRLVGLMGGSIVVESEEGVGSTFRVLAPFRVAKPKTSPTLEPAAAPGPPAPLWRGPQLRVLLAEDDPSNLGFGAALLKRMGLAATIVGDGAAALEAASAQPFDLLLLDLQMPVMDGRRAIGQLRERERATGAHVPAIALTAYSDDRGGASLLAEGFDGYLRKPLSVKLLVAEMERVLGLRREG